MKRPEVPPRLFLAWYAGKRIEIMAASLYHAKEEAIKLLKVPKSKRGLMAVMLSEGYERGDFRHV